MDVNDVISARTQAALELEKQAPQKDYSGMLPPEPNYMGDVANLAAQRRAQATFAPKYQQLQTQQKMADKLDVFKRLSGAFSNELQSLRMKYAKEYAEQQRKSQEEAQRANMLGSILGLGGMALGAYVGGAGGAVAGSQAGQAIGQNIKT